MPSTLIIGASRGLGLEFVRQLRQQGQNVLATARSDTDLHRLTDMGAQAISLNVASVDSLSDFDARIHAPDLTTVIHNAGVFGLPHGTDQAPSQDTFDQVMHTNVLGPMSLIPQLAPILAATRGRYVFLSSDMASLENVASSHGALYRSSKAALNMTMRCATVDYPQVIFLALSPGWVRTDMGGKDAPLSATESVKGMLATISQATIKDSGSFQNYQTEHIPW